MDKMRESFEKWAKAECLDTDSVDGFYSDNDTHIAWGSWQAAQSAAVPVVGEVVAEITEDGALEPTIDGLMKLRAGMKLIVQPATSITAAELDALRKDAERYRWIRHGDNDERCIHFTNDSPAGTDTVWIYRESELDKIIDAAIAGEKK